MGRPSAQVNTSPPETRAGREESKTHKRFGAHLALAPIATKFLVPAEPNGHKSQLDEADGNAG